LTGVSGKWFDLYEPIRVGLKYETKSAMKTIREILKTAIIRFWIIFNIPFKSEAQSVFQLNRRKIHFYSLPLQMVIYFTVIFIGLSMQKLIAQNTFQLNGRNLLLQEGKYYEVTTKDTLLIDMHNVIVKFKPGQENVGTTLLENTQGLIKKISSQTMSYILNYLPLQIL
jgi:hypothetical protein